MSAQIREVKKRRKYCASYDLVTFSEVNIPCLIPKTDAWKEGQYVLYFDTPRHWWRNNQFAGKLADPAEFGIDEPVDGDVYPFDLGDLF